MIELGILLSFIGVLILMNTIKQGITFDDFLKHRASLYDLLTELSSLGFYVIILGIIFILF